MPHPKIYACSKVSQAAKWRHKRDNEQWPIISRWIDYTPRTEQDFLALWDDIVIPDLISATHILVSLPQNNENPLKGGLLEIGAMLVQRKPIHIAQNGWEISNLFALYGTFFHSSLVTFCPDEKTAYTAILRS